MNKRGFEPITIIIIVIAFAVVVGSVAVFNTGVNTGDEEFSPKGGKGGGGATSSPKESSCDKALNNVINTGVLSSKDKRTIERECTDADLTIYAQSQGSGSSCEADLNGDGVVGVEDLLILLGNWGTPGNGDIDGDGVVGVKDLLILLGSWGPLGPECEFTGSIYPLFTSSNKIYFNDSINKIRDTLTDTELPIILADGQFFGNVAALYTHHIKIGSFPRVVYSKQPTGDDDPTINVELSTTATNALYNATITFSNAVNFTHPDSKGKDIILFGKQFTVGNETDSERLVLYDEKNQKFILINGAEVLVGIFEDPIDGTKVTFIGGTNAMVGLTIQVTAGDSDVDAILERDVFVDTVFGTFGIRFNNTNIPINDLANRENLDIENSGDDKMILTMKDHQGFEKNINWLLSDGNGNSVLADTTGDRIRILEMATVNRSEYAVIGNEDYGHLIEVITITNSSSGFDNDEVTLKDVFSDEIYEVSITSEGEGTVTIDGNTYNINYFGSSDSDSSSRYIRINYPDSSGNNLVIYPTVESDKGAKVGFYEPLTVNLINHNDESWVVTGFMFPDGDGYTEVSITLVAVPNNSIEGGNFTVNGQLVSPNTNATIDIGQISYEFTWEAPYTTKILLLDVSANNIENPGLIIFEEQDDSNNYEALIVMTEGEGTSFNGVGVKRVEETWWGLHYFITHESDTDFSSSMDRWGTHILMDASISDQKIAHIKYNDEQLWAGLYAVEIL